MLWRPQPAVPSKLDTIFDAVICYMQLGGDKWQLMRVGKGRPQLQLG